MRRRSGDRASGAGGRRLGARRSALVHRARAAAPHVDARLWERRVDARHVSDVLPADPAAQRPEPARSPDRRGSVRADDPAQRRGAGPDARGACRLRHRAARRRPGDRCATGAGRTAAAGADRRRRRPAHGPRPRDCRWAPARPPGCRAKETSFRDGNESPSSASRGL